jgi:hypothetical protein
MNLILTLNLKLDNLEERRSNNFKTMDSSLLESRKNLSKVFNTVKEPDS